jgi:hypothetical protein
LQTIRGILSVSSFFIEAPPRPCALEKLPRKKRFASGSASILFKYAAFFMPKNKKKVLTAL